MDGFERVVYQSLGERQEPGPLLVAVPAGEPWGGREAMRRADPEPAAGGAPGVPAVAACHNLSPRWLHVQLWSLRVLGPRCAQGCRTGVWASPGQALGFLEVPKGGNGCRRDPLPRGPLLPGPGLPVRLAPPSGGPQAHRSCPLAPCPRARGPRRAGCPGPMCLLFLLKRRLRNRRNMLKRRSRRF